jgi:hypothetical protein
MAAIVHGSARGIGWLRGALLSAIALALMVPTSGCSKSEPASSKSDDDKPSKKKASKAEDDDQDKATEKKKKKSADEDDEKVAQKKKETEDDPAQKKKPDDPPVGATTPPTATPTAVATATAPATGEVEDFAGTYTSNWGKSTFTQNAANITVVYPRGTMGCVAKGKTLYCRWNEKGTTGGAILTKQANGNVTGTWGNNASSTDGGSWTFSKS